MKRPRSKQYKQQTFNKDIGEEKKKYNEFSSHSWALMGQTEVELEMNILQIHNE